MLKLNKELDHVSKDGKNPDDDYLRTCMELMLKVWILLANETGAEGAEEVFGFGGGAF